MAVAPLNLTMLETVFTHMHIQGVTYKWGAKAPSLDCDTSAIKSIDCSGFVRYAIARATNQQLIVPDGSVNQHDWCRERKLPSRPYAQVANAAGNRLFIAFIPPVTGAHPGHVWFINTGSTMESHGGVGVDSRPWNTRVLVKEVRACYELPAISALSRTRRSTK